MNLIILKTVLLQNEINDAFRLKDIKKGLPHTLQCLKLTRPNANRPCLRPRLYDN